MIIDTLRIIQSIIYVIDKEGINMFRKARFITLTVLLIPFIWFYTGWLRNMIFLFNYKRDWDQPLPFNYLPLTAAAIATLLGIIITFLINIGKSQKSKFKIWGISAIILSTPMADALGNVYVIWGENLFAYLSAFIFLPIFLIIGIGLLLIGFFKKTSA